MRIDPESRALQGLTGFLAFVALNLLYLALCLPVVTIGAATSALYEVLIRYSDDESGRPLKDFLPAFGRNFGRATLVALCLLPPVVLLAFSGVFWFSHQSTLAGAASVISFLGAAYLFVAFLYGMAQVASSAAAPGRRSRTRCCCPGRSRCALSASCSSPSPLVALTILFPPFVFIADGRLLGRRLRDRVPVPQRLRPPSRPDRRLGAGLGCRDTEGARDAASRAPFLSIAGQPANSLATAMRASFCSFALAMSNSRTLS